MPLSRRTFLRSCAAGAIAPGLACAVKTGATDKETELPGKTPHTRFAVNVEIWWANQPIEERIRRAAALGYPAVEFWGCEGKDLDSIRRTCDETGLKTAQFTAWGFEPGMNDPANHDAFEKKIREACAAAKKLECGKATVVAGNDRPGVAHEEMLMAVTKALKRVSPVAEDAGLMLILEPMNIRKDHKGHCLYGSPDAVRITRDVNSPMVKINWDLYHMQISEGDLCLHLREGFDQVGYLQAADAPGRHEPGTGEINYSRVLKEAYDLGYRGFVGLECWPEKDPETAARRVALADRW
jgi:hydroxypyruvate isomerase